MPQTKTIDRVFIQTHRRSVGSFYELVHEPLGWIYRHATGAGAGEHKPTKEEAFQAACKNFHLVEKLTMW